MRQRKCNYCTKVITPDRAGSAHEVACERQHKRRHQRTHAPVLGAHSPAQGLQRRNSLHKIREKIRRNSHRASMQARESPPSHNDIPEQELSDHHMGEDDLGVPQADTTADEIEPEMASTDPADDLRRHAHFRDVLPHAGYLEPENGYAWDSVPFRTKTDEFGLYRVYPFGLPSYTPDSAYTLAHLADSAAHKAASIKFKPSAPMEVDSDSGSDSDSHPGDDSSSNSTSDDIPEASVFANKTISLLMGWYYGGGSVLSSKSRIDDLIKNVILHPDFRKEDLVGFRVDLGMKALDEYEANKIAASEETPFPVHDNWTSNTVQVPIPCKGWKYASWAQVPTFPLHGVMCRNIMDVICAAFGDSSAQFMHIAPFQEFHQSGQRPERQYGELYASDSFIEAHEEVKAIAAAEDCPYEVVVAALMVGSDGTLLSNFGSQSLWPVYLSFGNLSKYVRAKPTSFSMHHIAYIPKLPDAFEDWFEQNFGEKAGKDTLSHVRRELFQAIWLLLMNPPLMHAYRHGHDHEFWDFVIRRLFPRFFTYSADYLEKILGACIKNLSTCPCPRCLVSKSRVDQLGTPDDMAIREAFPRKDDEATRKLIQKARNNIYLKGHALKSEKFVTNMLGPQSLLPTQSAFSQRLSEFGVNSYDLWSPDQLHEGEIGVWLCILIHLLRILQSLGKLNDFNARFRDIPSFGRGTIRKFCNNVAAMIKFAARDFEDVLQCAIAVFEGLIPDDEPTNDGTVVRELLFEMATWHALAKLRRHSEQTTLDLDASTCRLGELLREFRDVICPRYDTRDLPTGSAAVNTKAQKPRKNIKKRKFSLQTYKIHALGHYAEYIRRKGTTDSYSSQNTEHEHVRAKRHWVRSAKAKAMVAPCIAKHQKRERHMWEIQQALNKQMKQKASKNRKKNPWFNTPLSESLPHADPGVHHQMSRTVKKQNRINLLKWVHSNKDDPALEGFIRKLKTHLLLRLLGSSADSNKTEFTDEELDTLIIVDNTAFWHKVLRINYTTYDMRREQDSINPRTSSDIMTLSDSPVVAGSKHHPYQYSKVLGVFHCRVIHRGPLSRSQEIQEMEFLWVRRYALDEGWQFGFEVKHLPRVGFVDATDNIDAALGFIDPAEVIRAVHLIQLEDDAQSNNGIGPSLIRKASEKHVDWNSFYVNFFVDRDMFMRYRGGAPGHAGVREAVDFFLQDRDDVDRRFQQEAQAKCDLEVEAAEDLQNNEDREDWNDYEEEVESDIDEDYGYSGMHRHGPELMSAEDDSEASATDSDSEGEERASNPRGRGLGRYAKL